MQNKTESHMMNIVTTNDPAVPAKYLAERIIEKLESGKKVFWFITGGSSIEVQILAAEIIAKHPHQNLTVTLSDERFGDVGHKDSNWQKTLDGGFRLPEAKLIPILTGESRDNAVARWNTSLTEELSRADYKIGLIGVGPDGHVSGILPHTEAVNAKGLSVGYKTEKFERITTTPEAISKLDEAITFMQGEAKWSVVKDLAERNIEIFEQPAQILKSIPNLTIFTDYTNS